MLFLTNKNLYLYVLLWINTNFFSQVSHGDEASQNIEEEEEEAVQQTQANITDISSVLGNSQPQILAAQFECYLKIIYDPPRSEEGDSAVSVYRLHDKRRLNVVRMFCVPQISVLLKHL